MLEVYSHLSGKDVDRGIRNNIERSSLCVPQEISSHDSEKSGEEVPQQETDPDKGQGG